MTARVRFAARDPGGANVLAGFLARQGDALPHDIWCLPKAAPVFTRAGLTVREFPEAFDAATLAAAWKNDPAELLITGTSHYAGFEAALWDLARQTGGKSLAINDAWVNLPARFVHGRPDFIGAVDEGQIAELTALGFRREQVIVTGHPWLADLMARRESILTSIVPPPRTHKTQVLFVSESIASDVAQGVNAPFGFTEFDSFAWLHQAAARVASATNTIELAIKFHPYEDESWFHSKLAELPAVPHLSIRPLDRKTPPHPWLLWSDLVTGIGSMLLLEAIVLGRPVVSLQPGLIRENTFIAATRGYATTFTSNQVLPQLSALLQTPELRQTEQALNQKFLTTLPRDPAASILRWIHPAQAV